MNETFFVELQKEMEKSIAALRKEFARLRTGRASTALLEGIMVDYYGTATPLNQLAGLAAPEPRLLVVQTYDRGAIGNIEKAILKTDLGLTPNNDGELIRLQIPPLDQERRQDLVKRTHTLTEEARIRVRGARRDCNDIIRQMEKDKDLSEDEMHSQLDEVQKLTDACVTRIEKISEAKEAELLKV